MCYIVLLFFLIVVLFGGTNRGREYCYFYTVRKHGNRMAVFPLIREKIEILSRKAAGRDMAKQAIPSIDFLILRYSLHTKQLKSQNCA